MKQRTTRRWGGAAIAALLSCGVVPGLAGAHDGPDGPEHHQGLSSDELNKQLANPISEVWSLTLENNMTFLRGGPSHSYRGQFTSTFEPAMPFHVTEDWNLIVRPTINFQSTPALDSGGGFDRANGIGQSTLVAVASPSKIGPSGVMWALGPTAILPTTTRDELSQRKYAIGPAAVAIKTTEWGLYGIFGQYWWSVSGSDKRREVSQANIQYFLWRSLGDGWQIGFSPNITYDRKASGSNAWTVPVGLGVSKLVHFGKLPVRFKLEGQAAVIHPDDFGQRWNIKFAITPVIPALVKGNLF